MIIPDEWMSFYIPETPPLPQTLNCTQIHMSNGSGLSVVLCMPSVQGTQKPVFPCVAPVFNRVFRMFYPMSVGIIEDLFLLK